MKSEMEKLESKTHNLPVQIDAEAVSSMKSEVCDCHSVYYFFFQTLYNYHQALCK